MSNTTDMVSSCRKTTDYSVYSRRCFMTGEYCSKQMNIQRERKKLHDKNEINAFVVMNFSDMSDVVYKWRLRSFIESLNQYLWIHEDTKELYCFPSKDDVPEDNKDSKKNKDAKGAKWKKVSKINVIRADSNPASNYVICNRVCQQLQIADLVIVDVSVENTNVFYEFGMAVAMGKLILPICYSSSLYDIRIPYDINEVNSYRDSDHQVKHDEMQKHIGCYPWRKRLFEYYGLRFRKKDLEVEYKPFEEVTKADLKFEDMQYNRFPYDASVEVKGGKQKKCEGKSHEQENEGAVASNEQKEKKKIGELLYGRLKASYGSTNSEEDAKKKDTLLVYTMDGFLNGDEAGQCIINFYNHMTQYMWDKFCFCGDRVGILGQTHSIFDDPKDSKTGQVLGYRVEDIIRIGMNEATYVAQTEKIKTGDFLPKARGSEIADSGWKEETIRFVKEHIRNRCVPIYPDNPIYVREVQSGIQQGVLDTDNNVKDYFCLFHIMVDTLKYTNEVVVDISKNSLQALFWLGAAHGKGVNAITVKQILTEADKKNAPEDAENEGRSIFDVAGLWTAVFRSNDTEGFYRQLALAQMGIEQHTKLMLRDMEGFKNRMIDMLYESYMDKNVAGAKADNSEKGKAESDSVEQIFKDKKSQEEQALESFYRDRFWRRMHRNDQLRICLPEKEGHTEIGEPKLLVVKWDVEAMANLSHYLSKRKIIGQYHIETLKKEAAEEKKTDRTEQNLICIGRDAEPFAGTPNTSLAKHICSQLKKNALGKGMGFNTVHELVTAGDRSCPDPRKNTSNGSNTIHMMKIFQSIYPDNGEEIKHPFVQITCLDCDYDEMNELCLRMRKGRKEFLSEHKLEHTQYGQLLLWRERTEDISSEEKFYVSLVGASGPSTLALASLLVDDDQKEKMGCVPKEGVPFPLSDLQKSAREKLILLYCTELNEALKVKGVDKDTKLKAEYASVMYLSTVLYQYFLPFLSRADEIRIENGMKAFTTAMQSAKNGYFECLENCYEAIQKTLETVLRGFRGVEAFYKVEVCVDDIKKDSRKIEGIRRLVQENKPVVSCLFLKSERINSESRDG